MYGVHTTFLEISGVVTPIDNFDYGDRLVVMLHVRLCTQYLHRWKGGGFLIL